jgi:hypothetical protein
VLNLANDVITIEVNAKELIRALERAPREIERAIERAGMESGQNIIKQEGLKAYPIEPQWEGYRYKRGGLRSERYGTKWNTRYASLQTTIGNSASYARYLAGEEQSRKVNMHIPGLGWRKLMEVAREQLGEIKSIFEYWIKLGLHRAGLK